MNWMGDGFAVDDGGSSEDECCKSEEWNAVKSVNCKLQINEEGDESMEREEWLREIGAGAGDETWSREKVENFGVKMKISVKKCQIQVYILLKLVRNFSQTHNEILLKCTFLLEIQLVN